tara:strand:+ start:86 stop:622 length:537 start_codon:yes stop_codon:yes gene_type:complete
LANLFKKKYKKVGVLGGTFDPPHIAHIYISKIALKKFNLDCVIWIITKQNPLKSKPELATKIRLGLSRILLKKEKKIFVKYLDELIKSKNTFDLINFLQKKNKKIKFFFLMGADNFINFHKWKNWKKIPKVAKIIVFNRPRFTKKALRSAAAKKLEKNEWMYIKSKGINISSSLIRKF